MSPEAFQILLTVLSSILALAAFMFMLAEVAVKTDKNVNPKLRKKMDKAKQKSLSGHHPKCGCENCKGPGDIVAEWLRDHWEELEYEWVPTPGQEWKDREDADVI